MKANNESGWPVKVFQVLRHRRHNRQGAASPSKKAIAVLLCLTSQASEFIDRAMEKVSTDLPRSPFESFSSRGWWPGTYCKVSLGASGEPRRRSELSPSGLAERLGLGR